MHCIATDLLKKSVLHMAMEAFLHTSHWSHCMLKNVYGQFFGSNKRNLRHLAVISHACNNSKHSLHQGQIKFQKK
jgi:hypothetical protein